MKRTVLIIVPAYNESQKIQKTIKELQACPYELCFIDDGSDDGTKDLLEASGETVLKHEKNMGQGAALRSGMTYAVSNGFEIVVHFDADGQHQVDDLERMIEPVTSGNYDVSIGSRFLSRESRGLIPLSKRLLLRCAIVFEWFRTGIRLTDAHCGFRCLNHKAYTALALKYDRYAHASEILTEIKRNKLRFCEVPVTVLYEGGQGKISDLKRIFEVIGALVLRSKPRK